MQTNKKILAGFALLSVIFFSIKMKTSAVVETETPVGYAAPKSIAALKIEEDKAYAKALADLENEEQARIKAEAAKAKPVIAMNLPAAKVVKVATLGPKLKSAKRKSSKITRTVAFKPSGYRRARRGSAKVLVSHTVPLIKKLPKSAS